MAVRRLTCVRSPTSQEQEDDHSDLGVPGMGGNKKQKETKQGAGGGGAAAATPETTTKKQSPEGRRLLLQSQWAMREDELVEFLEMLFQWQLHKQQVGWSVVSHHYWALCRSGRRVGFVVGWCSLLQ
jgi:hypothetical protein